MLLDEILPFLRIRKYACEGSTHFQLRNLESKLLWTWRMYLALAQIGEQLWFI
jgi:hypothetical protein